MNYSTGTIENVGKFSPPPAGSFFTTIRQHIWPIFDPSPPKRCRRLKWMVPYIKILWQTVKNMTKAHLFSKRFQNIWMHFKLPPDKIRSTRSFVYCTGRDILPRLAHMLSLSVDNSQRFAVVAKLSPSSLHPILQNKVMRVGKKPFATHSFKRSYKITHPAQL